jgi:hypothetical protein
MKRFTVLDNNGETLDRYTIIDNVTGDCYGASENPFHGFGQYCGNISDNYWNVAYGYSWRKRGDKKHINKLIRFAVSNYISQTSDKNVNHDALPEQVQQYIKQLSA